MLCSSLLTRWDRVGLHDRRYFLARQLYLVASNHRLSGACGGVRGKLEDRFDLYRIFTIAWSDA